MDLSSGHWVVRYTELAAETAAFKFFDVSDTFHLWRVSVGMIEYSRKLRLKLAMASNWNVMKFD